MKASMKLLLAVAIAILIASPTQARRFLSAGGSSSGSAPPSGTIFTSATCDSTIEISNGGLTLTVIVNDPVTIPGCSANTAKYSGKWYFTNVPNTVGYSYAVGLSDSIWGTAQAIANTPDSVGYVLTTGGSLVQTARFGAFGQPPTGSVPYTTGKTIGVAVDMDVNPRQFWVTTDVTGTGGCGGGPLWNGSTTSSPTFYSTGANSPCGGPGTGPGTFGPGDTGGTGVGFFLVGAFPSWNGQDAFVPASVGTFDFGDNASLDAAIPGYQPWNNSGGGPGVPGPLNPLTRNVANAPAWQPTTAYTSFPNDDRIVAGPGYSPTTALYTNGQPLYLWAVATGGGGTSGSNGSYAATFASCPSPANVGGTVAPGGYTGSGAAAWAAATHVTDGSVTWVCLASVDYTTFTGANVDDVTTWATSSPFFALQFFVTPAGNAYYTSPTSPGITPPSSITCTSGSIAPTATTYGTPITDGTCSLYYQGQVGYSSKAHIVPHALASFYLTSQGATAQTSQYNYSFTTQLWWGGAANQQYVDNAGGEAYQIAQSGYLAQFTDSGFRFTCPGAATLTSSLDALGAVTCFNLGSEHHGHAGR